MCDLITMTSYKLMLELDSLSYNVSAILLSVLYFRAVVTSTLSWWSPIDLDKSVLCYIYFTEIDTCRYKPAYPMLSNTVQVQALLYYYSHFYFS